MTPRTDPHANVTPRADFPPIFETGLSIQLPAQRSIHLDGLIHGYGIGWAADRTFLTNPAEILHADIHRRIRH